MVRSFRAALSDVLLKSANENPKIVVLNADSARALKLSEFGEKHPDRLIGYGISESDMVTGAAGMSTTGIIPIVVGFSMFVSNKPFEQIRQSICYPNLNIKIIATHAGLCVGQDGATHQNLEDIAVLRALPNMNILVAADVAQTESAIDTMIRNDGPFYLRLGRDLAQDIYTNGCEVIPGGSDLLLEGDDVTIVASGLMVEQSLKAAKLLKDEGIKASVMNAYSIKPFDEKNLLDLAKKTRAIVSVEDHTVIGGLGGAIAEILSRKLPTVLESVGVNDVFGESGSQAELYEKYGLTPKSIAEAAKRAIARKG
ncbi:MAG TPA: transketolase C-terminal domain-containing protein [Clostridia bacterium]|nr:transketolase C-terminal domain-containing protein [Clostridia bacterium]